MTFATTKQKNIAHNQNYIMARVKYGVDSIMLLDCPLLDNTEISQWIKL